MARSSGTFTPQDPVRRFYANVVPQANGCWEWTGHRSDRGYGVFFLNTNRRAHRVSWEMHRGEIPTGTELDHLCGNRACVNVEHLEPVTHHENVLRGVWHQKTHCKNGHAFTPENTAPKGIAGRRCRTCTTERSRARRANEGRLPVADKTGTVAA